MRRLLAFLTAVVLILEPLAAQAAPLQQLGEEVMGVQGRILASEELPTEEYEDTQEPVVPDTGTQDQAIESSAPGTADPSGSEETPAEGSGAPEAGMPAEGSSMGISAPSAILMEASTGTVIAEKNAHQQLPPASVTKIMTLLLIFDNLGTGKIKLEDSVMTSAYAASMGGSQVFLEEGETQTVDTMIKCISVASANDASVAMAEHIAGSEELFVEWMNERAQGLGMADTHFVNCCGLDVEGHVTSAYDIALMSRELITKYPQIHNYSTIWMENITHTTRRGSEEFGLTNTNKLIRQYPYATGLKTGSTSQAKFCLSATAEKDGIELIAVIMAAPDPKIRFADAKNLLNYGYSKCSLYKDTDKLPPVTLPVELGVKEEIKGEYDGSFSYLSTTGEELKSIKKEWVYNQLEAPVEKGAQIGCIRYLLNGKELGQLPILAAESVEKAGYRDYLLRTAGYWLL
ncbi:MAG: D-alanyl-D-alanine carboxypeptidase [Lachnospiraceae bacterium]|nr:D-alanyl-D-alanine carboxypeptidase [Lachnospiraceae bacterium]MCI8996138.1 D-alanyl-D-alanine carboxypeptidase [Lachnospiraceae bacterium]